MTVLAIKTTPPFSILPAKAWLIRLAADPGIGKPNLESRLLGTCSAKGEIVERTGRLNLGRRPCFAKRLHENTCQGGSFSQVASHRSFYILFDPTGDHAQAARGTINGVWGLASYGSWLGACACHTVQRDHYPRFHGSKSSTSVDGSPDERGQGEFNDEFHWKLALPYSAHRGLLLLCFIWLLATDWRPQPWNRPKARWICVTHFGCPQTIRLLICPVATHCTISSNKFKSFVLNDILDIF
jgi:hypothetical protein